MINSVINHYCDDCVEELVRVPFVRGERRTALFVDFAAVLVRKSADVGGT
jgi:hypothetical protein